MNKQEVLKIRDEFFNNILEKMSEPPNKVDEFLNQQDLHFPPILDEVEKNIEYGDLIIPVNVTFFEKEYKIYYTVWQVGTKIKIAVALPHLDLQTAITEDSYQEINSIWGKDNVPTIEAANQIYLIDWEFEEKGMYDSYINIEKYVLGIRHLNFRICRIIHDKLKRELDIQNSPMISEYYSK